MKFIVKQGEPEELSTWKSRQPRTYDSMKRGRGLAVKKILKQSLLDEQGYLCCYCERRVFKDNSHIEHFKPKGAHYFPELQLEYSNLHCSCEGKNNSTNPSTTCGHKKDNYYDEFLLSPLDPECENLIKYSSSGELEGADSVSKNTIEKLGLNDFDLIRSRKNVIDGYLLNDNTTTEIKTFLEVGCKYHIFYTSIVQFFNII